MYRPPCATRIRTHANALRQHQQRPAACRTRGSACRVHPAASAAAARPQSPRAALIGCVFGVPPARPTAIDVARPTVATRPAAVLSAAQHLPNKCGSVRRRQMGRAGGARAAAGNIGCWKRWRRNGSRVCVTTRRGLDRQAHTSNRAEKRWKAASITAELSAAGCGYLPYAKTASRTRHDVAAREAVKARSAAEQQGKRRCDARGFGPRCAIFRRIRIASP